METRRLISIIIASVAALLVMFAGKSCTDDIQKKNRKSHKTQPTTQHVTPTFNNFYGNPGETTETTTETNNNIETITNLIGQVIGTVTVTTPNDPIPEETTTVSKSILEIYNEKHTTQVTETEAHSPQETTEIVIYID